MDLLNAELLYGGLLCRFRSSDDGIRRCRNVAAIASKHHGDESLTVELAFEQLAECLRRHGDLAGGASMAVSAYRMATSAMSPRRGDSRRWRTRGGYAVQPRASAECAEFRTKPGARRGDACGAGQVADAWALRLAQVRVLILQGTTDEAEALAAQFLIEPLCCELTLRVVRSWALRLGGRFDEAARAADQAISMLRAKGGLFDQQRLAAGLARVGRTRFGETRAGAGFGRAGDVLDD